MKKIFVAFTAAVVLSAASVQAQTWAALGTPLNNGGQFWDNPSADGTNCNSGFVLTGVAGTLGNECFSGAQRPAGWLPYAGATPTTYLQNGSGGFQAFLFTPGSYAFSFLPATVPGGDIAGANTAWGYYDYASGARTTLSSGPLPVGFITFTGNWGLWMQLDPSGVYAYSFADPQFALFGFNTPGSAMTNSGTRLIAGFEDTRATDGGGSDRDYQDAFVQIDIDDGSTTQELVPEPATMTLLATGLAGMAAASRRRRKN